MSLEKCSMRSPVFSLVNTIFHTNMYQLSTNLTGYLLSINCKGNLTAFHPSK